MRHLFLKGLFAGLAGFLTVGCERGADANPAPAAPPPKPVNVVMFLIDTLRADRVGVYGYDKPTTPNIDALAAECVLFENAHSAEGWTLPSVPSIFTSTLPCEHGLTIDRTRLDDSFETLAQRLKSAGYRTASLYVNPYLGDETGLSRGFDTADRVPFVNGARVASWLEANATTPYFLYLHNLEPHDPWWAPGEMIEPFGKVPPAIRKRLEQLVFRYKPLLRENWKEGVPLGSDDNSDRQAALLRQIDRLLPELNILYDAAVRFADERLGQVVRALKRRGDWDNTLFIVLSDHGEELSDHGAYIHGQSVYQELIHVPLLIHFPRGEFAGRRVPDNISLIDVLPTIMDYLKRPELLNGVRGQSLMPLVRGEGARPDDVPLVTSVRMNSKKYYRPWAETRGNVNVALRQGSWKAIWNKDHDTMELYDLATDPGEQTNVAEQNAELAARFRQAAMETFEACSAATKHAAESPLSPEQEKALKSLGYLGGETPEEDEPQP